jgi:hypothetical protein
MKRIIDGATYNTDTATVIAEGIYEDENRDIITVTTLYQTPAGIFFEVEEITKTYRDRDGDLQERKKAMSGT